jgi:hypothetical protein
MKKYLPKNKRASKGVPFALTERDFAILEALNRFRFLRTSQIKHLLFSENKTVQSTHRRLKYLFHNKYVGRVTPYVQYGQGNTETAYFLDKKGIELLKENDIDIYPYSYHKPGQVRFKFLHHSLDISEFRVYLEIALKDHLVVELKRFVTDFEMRLHIGQAVGKKRYRLYDEIIHPVNKQTYIVYPDALIIFTGKGEYQKFQRLFFLEIDRGTEGLTKIKDKVIGYNLYREQKIFTKYGKFPDFTVLFQTSSEKRAGNMRDYLTDVKGTELVWITDHTKVNEDTILQEKIWKNHELEMKSIVK